MNKNVEKIYVAILKNLAPIRNFFIYIPLTRQGSKTLKFEVAMSTTWLFSNFSVLKGTVARDFWPLVFFTNPPHIDH
jgi:hypothetical protein